MLSHRTINYAIPPDDHFWKWSEGRDAIEWSDGRTLALWPEVHTVLGYLGAEKGIPPLGTILLVLAACRSDWPSQRAPNHAAIRSVMGISANEPIPAEVAAVLITGLDQIHQLPQDLRGSLAAKCHLMAALFEGGPHCLLRRDSEQVLRDLSIFGLYDAENQKPEMTAKARFLRDIRALKTGLARHNTASLESLLRTGLETATLIPPELPQQPLEPGDPRELIERLLQAGGEGGAAASVAKRAIAMINFPGRFGAPRDLPVGGISDIANRGTIDRLLPGELAWDDLVLAARLVHNEALYFRREIPPMDVAVSHTVLLDRGIRLWGSERIISLGIALGLRHHPAWRESNEIFEVAAATRDAFEFIDLTTPAGVFHALETLIPLPDPVKFLTTWWDSAKIIDDPLIPDLTFITACEHLEEEDVRFLLGEIAAWIHAKSGHFRVIALSRGGGMEMQVWSPAGNRVLCRGTLSLGDMMETPRIEPSAIEAPWEPDPLSLLLPVYANKRLPFLFAHVPQYNTYLLDDAGEGLVGVSQDRGLMLWPGPGCGAWELHCQIPGRQHWIGRDDNGDVIVIASGEAPGEVVRVFRWSKDRFEEIQVVSSRHAFPRFAAVSGNAAILAYSTNVEALSLTNGTRLAEMQLDALPANPRLLFDGKMIEVKVSENEPASVSQNWSYEDDTWPRQFQPTHFSLEKNVLRVKTVNDCLAFDPVKLTWSIVREGATRFTAFENTEFSPAPGVILKRGMWGDDREVWLDPRGILHLRKSDKSGFSPWSILLTTPAASVWNHTHQLFSHEKRLLPPGASSPSRAAMTELNHLLSSP